MLVTFSKYDTVGTQEWKITELGGGYVRVALHENGATYIPVFEIVMNRQEFEALFQEMSFMSEELSRQDDAIREEAENETI